MTTTKIACLLSVLAGAAGCGTPTGAADAPAVNMRFARAAFYDAPFPSDDLLKADGTVDVSRVPNPDAVEIIRQALELVARDARGFAVSGAIYFSLTAAIDAAALPDLTRSAAADSPAFLIDLDRGTRQPVSVQFTADGGPLGAPNLLSLLPLQGIPMRAAARYAAVVRRSLGGSAPLAVSAEMAQIAAGTRPAGLGDAVFAEYRAALATLATAGVPSGDIAGLAVFTTDDPEAGMRVFRDDVLARPLPVPTAFTMTTIFPDYCVYNATVDLPDYQQGDAPYSKTGGAWIVDERGKPLPPHMEKARLVVTIPRAPTPAAGFPTVVLVRTGAGGDNPLTDRGVQPSHDAPPLVAGSGPAREFARVGFAGVQVDGPLGGLRNTTGNDEQFLVFNVFNASALRDNVRESALELVVLAHVLPSLAFDTTTCPGASPAAKLDTNHLAIMGHSMGASIAPLAVAAEPLYRAMVLSGAGGSYIENIMWKRKPVRVLPLAEAMLDYDRLGRSLVESDAALSLVQWAAESSDSQVYAHHLIREPAAGAQSRHVLMLQGIIDNYIMPRIANAISLPLGLDLGGAPLDRGNATLQMEEQTPILDVLGLVGRGQITLPAGGNLTPGGVRVTGIVVQHAEDGIEDGHEVVFQTEPPKHQYRCFLAGFAKDLVPTVPTDGPADAPCN